MWPASSWMERRKRGQGGEGDSPSEVHEIVEAIIWFSSCRHVINATQMPQVESSKLHTCLFACAHPRCLRPHNIAINIQWVAYVWVKYSLCMCDVSVHCLNLLIFLFGVFITFFFHQLLSYISVCRQIIKILRILFEDGFRWKCTSTVHFTPSPAFR